MTGFRPRKGLEWVQTLWRRKFLLLVSIAVLLSASIIAIKRVPDFYDAHAVIVVSRWQDRDADNARVTAAREQLNSRSNLIPLIQKYGLYPKQMERGGVDGAVTAMQTDVHVETNYRNESPESLEVTFRYDDPTTASKVLTDLLGVFTGVNKSIEQQVNDDATSVHAQIQEADQRLSQLGEQRESAAAGERIATRALDAQNAARLRREAEASSVETLTDRQILLERQIHDQEAQIEQQKTLVSAAAASNPSRAAGSYGVLLVRKAELEAQLKDYLAQYTEKNPKVVQVQSQLTEIDRQISQLESNPSGADPSLTTPEATELRSLQRDLGRMNAELEITNREFDRKKKALAGLPDGTPAPVGSGAGAGGAGEPGQAEYDRLRDQYEVLVNRGEALRKAQATMAFGTGFFQLIEAPSVPRIPAGPNRTKLLAVAVGVALAFAIALGVALEVRRLPVIQDYRDVEYFLGVPVVAQIPESVTVESDRRRSIAMVRGIGPLLLVAAAIAFVPVLAILLNTLGVFQILGHR